jgi:MipA family protein
MEKLLVLALTAACGTALAQTPASNPMPDGSRDMYIGLGAVSTPRYEGASERKLRALPVLQVQWSNGVFVSGMSAGIHLSNDPSVEFGPLLAVQPRRSDSGTGNGVDDVEKLSLVAAPQRGAAGPHGLAGMDPIGTRLLAGGFYNRYLAPQWRLTSSLLYGAGRERDGALLELGVQHLAVEVAPHHTLSLMAGLALVNRNYNQAYFGVTGPESVRSGYRVYNAAGGFKDAHLGARWNWALAPAWLLTTGVQASRLARSPAHSPLVQRPTNLTVLTAIAYRF